MRDLGRDLTRCLAMAPQFQAVSKSSHHPASPAQEDAGLAALSARRGRSFLRIKGLGG
ncbi:hypothetical protein [Campylobacter sp.]|uniref:hypothetical protein n=1 Tax=Campylobacter sp. TaxID=205 RepID=UPI0026DD7D07|nr:hypothetical protein [Campylobacter sp.]